MAISAANQLPSGHPSQPRVRFSRREVLVVALLVVSVVINYVDRSNLSMALPSIERQFALSPYQISALLSALFWTYASFQLIGISGWLSDRFRPGWVLFWGYLLWAVVNGLTSLSTGFASIFLLRLVLGAGESVAYPCYSRIFAEMPQQLRGRANALIDAGTKLGPAAGAFLAGIVLVHLGWRVLFALFGAIAVLWLLPWSKAMPRVGAAGSAWSGPVPPGTAIFRIFRLKCAWGTFIGHFCGNYFYYFLLTWMPRYLVQEEHVSVALMSQITAALFLLIGCSTLVAGFVSDRLIARGFSPTVVRRSITAGGLTVASCMVFSSLVHGHTAASIALLAVTSIGYGAFSSNHWAITQTLAGPAMAGRWSSLQNGAANFSGVAAPWVAGLVLTREGNSRLAFTISGLVALLGAFCWGVLVDRVEPVCWTDPEHL